MIHLDKISISNARRFGKDVEIKFGKGATILLAPNGTGKTTVFEAIELALTGQFKRVGYPPIALIRDMETELDVRLDFNNNYFCEVAFRKGENPIIKGNHDELFGKNKDSVPYLLRLTHLLEQRGTEWFVDSEENNAGNRLDKLSIGRELNQIISKKRSVLTAITKELARLKRNAEESKGELTIFNKKIEDRSKVRLSINLIPLSEIYRQIELSYQLVYDSTELKVEENVNSVIAFAEQTKSVINQKLQDNSGKSHLYAELDKLIELYDNNNVSLSIKQKEYDARLIDIQRIEGDLNNFKRNKEEEKNKFNDQLNKLEELNKLKVSIILLHTKNKENEQAAKDIVLLNQNLLELQKNLKSTNDNLENENKLIDKHKLINTELIKIQAEKFQIENLESLQKKWEIDYLTSKNFNEETIPNITKQILSLEDVISVINEDLRLSNLNYEEKVKSLNLLKQASDAIQEAVSVIATNLPKDRRDCPVCEADYEPGYLQERISNALNKINPLIDDAVSDEKQALERLEHIKSLLSIEKVKLEKLYGDLEKNKIKANELINSIQVEIQPSFLNCQSAKDAAIFVNEKKEALNVRTALLNKNKIDIKPEPNIESINGIKVKKSELERKVEDLKKKIYTVNGNIIYLKDLINDIQLKIGDSSLEKVDADIKIIEELKNRIKEAINKIEQKGGNYESQNVKLIEQNLKENEIISKLKSQQDVIQSKWDNLKLVEIPSKEKLLEVKSLLLKETKELVDAKEKLQKLDEELSRWRSAEKYESLDKEIKEIIAPHNEHSYLEKLESEIRKNTGLLINFDKKQSTLKGFFDNANNELSSIHNYIKSINPYWSALLKRVLINPRFSESDLLNSGTYNNKLFANVKASLHDGKMNVANIASEAQLTDLQFTFMLSMAKTYEWTPWKALLLDDPTQHHDLVHASSVFDLLRDYIVDLDYQVMMSTHDSIQADFFQRKLQNDGIETKIYRLKSTSNGVIAEYLY